MANELDFQVNEHWKKFLEKEPWRAHIPEYAMDDQEQIYMKMQGRKQVYKIISENEKGQHSCICNDCGSDILATKVAHPIWDGLFACSGSGECKYEDAPYCPTCETKPTSHGTPFKPQGN